jgi:Protein of unknown function (DUF3800)
MPRWFWFFAPEWVDFLWAGAPLRPGPMGRLALALWPKWEPERLFVILTVYIDESGTHGPSDYMIMGAIVGRLGQLVDHDRKWGRLLKKNRLSYFHSKKLKARKDEFTGWSNQSSRALIAEINKIQNNNSLFRFVTLIRKDDFKKFYKDGPNPRRLQKDSLYGMAFRCSLSFAVEMTLLSVPRKGLTINFLVESGHPNAGACHVIFDQIKENVPEMAEILGECLIKPKKDFPGLQSADAISYAGYQQEYHGDESELMDFEFDWKLANAKKVLKAKSPVFRCDVRSDILAEMKENLFKLAEKRREHWRSKPKLIAASGE